MNKQLWIKINIVSFYYIIYLKLIFILFSILKRNNTNKILISLIINLLNYNNSEIIRRSNLHNNSR